MPVVVLLGFLPGGVSLLALLMTLALGRTRAPYRRRRHPQASK